MSQSKNIVIREYTKGDEASIIGLMRENWPHLAHQDALSRWEWEYMRGQQEAIITVAEHDGRVVGNYTVIPLMMKCGSDRILGAKAEGAAIHPDYRKGMGNWRVSDGEHGNLFNALITRTLEKAKEVGVRLVWGFPNKVAMKGQLKAGYSLMTVPMSFFVLPVDKTKTMKVLLSRRPRSATVRKAMATWPDYPRKLLGVSKAPEYADEDPNLTEIQDDLAGLEGLWRRYAEENDCITLERSPEYLKWRVSRNPVLPHRIFASRENRETNGYIVFTAVRARRIFEGRIIDVLGSRGHDVDLARLVAHSVELLKKQCVDFVTANLISNGKTAAYAKVLRDSGFIELPSSPMNVLVKGFQVPEEFVTRPDNWYITTIFTEGVA